MKIFLGSYRRKQRPLLLVSLIGMLLQRTLHQQLELREVVGEELYTCKSLKEDTNKNQDLS